MKIKSLIPLIIFPFALSATAAPASQKDSGGDVTALVLAIERLSQHLTNLKTAEIESQNNKDYQSIHDPNEHNPNEAAAQNMANQYFQANTQQQITDWLSDVPIRIGLVKADDKKPDPVTELTTNTIASDTLLIPSKPSYPASGDSNPPQKEDPVFNFDSLFAPAAYTPEQQKAVEKYKQFLSPHYEPSSKEINFDKLKNIIRQHPEKAVEYLQRFQDSEAYKKYQLTTRSKMATDSLILSNLNALIAERTPVNSQGSFMSPLQIAQQKANLADDPAWRNKINAASPAAVQREQLQLLADIRQELHYIHQTNERILSTLTGVLNLASQFGQTSLQAQDVNRAIDALDSGVNARQKEKVKGQISQAQALRAQQEKQQNGSDDGSFDDGGE